MSLASLLSAEQIIPEMQATERWPAIVELIELLVKLGRIKADDRESILASLKQREETMSTGIPVLVEIKRSYRRGARASDPGVNL
jgi:mannitol/fructose-specific phosphotransferase system IIA component (Ntr-type)